MRGSNGSFALLSVPDTSFNSHLCPGYIICLAPAGWLIVSAQGRGKDLFLKYIWFAVLWFSLFVWLLFPFYCYSQVSLRKFSRLRSACTAFAVFVTRVAYDVVFRQGPNAAMSIQAPKIMNRRM